MNCKRQRYFATAGVRLALHPPPKGSAEPRSQARIRKVGYLEGVEICRVAPCAQDMARLKCPVDPQGENKQHVIPIDLLDARKLYST